MRSKFFQSLSILTGLFLALSFWNIGLNWFIWFGFSPFLIVIEREDNPRRLIINSVLCGLIFFSLSLYWICYVSFLGIIFLVGYLLIYFVLFSICIRFLYRIKVINSVNQFFVIPSVWVMLEYLRSHLFSGFGWASLGYCQYLNLHFIQIAELTGVYGVSFLIILVNIFIKEFVLNVKSIVLFDKRYLKRFILVSLITLSCILVVYTYGDVKLNNKIEGRELTISVIQGNIPQHQKWQPFYRNLIFEKYKKLTRMASFDRPDIIIWPETSLPGYLDEEDLFREISGLAKEIEKPLLIGAATIGEDKDVYYNSACLISKDGSLEGVYNKIHLVPFGEYLPLPFIFGFIDNMYEIAGWTKGKEYTLFDIKGNKFGVLICFEDIFSDLVRDFINQGADFMLNITNDAWFGRSPEAYQHLQASVFRAVENRVNIVRAANTGVSCFIDPYGRVIDRVSSKNEDIFIQGYKTQTIFIKEMDTFYTRFGDLFVLLCFFLTIIYLLKGFVFKARL